MSIYRCNVLTILEIFQISVRSETKRDKRFSINRDKCGAKHYWLSNPNELSDLQMSGAKVRI